MKRKLLYLSPDCFFDTDELVLTHLAAVYEVTWVALLSVVGARTRDKADVEMMARRAGVKLHVKEMSWRRRSFSQLLFDFRLLKEMKSMQADILYVEDVADLFFYLLQPLFLNRLKTVCGLHDVIPHPGKGGLMSKLNAAAFDFTRWLHMRWAHHVHIFSRTEYAHFRKKYPSKNAFFTRLILKPYGDSELTAGDINNHCRFLFFGAIEFYKGLDLLIQAVEELIAAGHTKLSVTIAGRGEYWNECGQIVKNRDFYNLNIRFIRDDEIPALFSEHHFLVLPYRNASQSGPQMISLEYNLPVIVSDVEGLSDFVVDGATGFVFQRNNVDALKKVLLQCLQMNADDYTSMRLKLDVWKQEHYRVEDTMGKYIRFFDDVIAKNNE